MPRHLPDHLLPRRLAGAVVLAATVAIPTAAGAWVLDRAADDEPITVDACAVEDCTTPRPLR